MKKIVMTGGGSAGHVTPNIALIPKLKEQQWDIHYIGSKEGIERELIEAIDIPYYPIDSGKLRRYFDWKNFKDPFKVLTGVAQAFSIIRKIKPDVIFSKGGFVSVPVVIAGWLNHIPVYIHESDITPGLANRIAVKFATKIFVTFEEASAHLPAEKAVHAGSPIREEILQGKKNNGLDLLGFSLKKPVITVMGGSLGSKRLNDAVRAILPDLLKNFQVIHLCGKGNIDENVENLSGYKQFEYVNKELPDLLAATDLVVSRAGSNAIFEFLALRKPMLLIPLSKNASRGDQILNAQSFEKKGFADVLFEEDLTKETLFEHIDSLYQNRYEYKDKMNANSSANGVDDILKTLAQTAQNN